MIPVRAPGREAWAALVATLRTQTPACEGDARFTADEFDAEMRRDLREVCGWCPIADACRTAAMSGRPDAGFWAGQVYGRERAKDQALADDAPALQRLNETDGRVSEPQTTITNAADGHTALAASRGTNL